MQADVFFSPSCSALTSFNEIPSFEFQTFFLSRCSGGGGTNPRFESTSCHRIGFVLHHNNNNNNGNTGTGFDNNNRKTHHLFWFLCPVIPVCASAALAWPNRATMPARWKQHQHQQTDFIFKPTKNAKKSFLRQTVLVRKKSKFKLERAKKSQKSEI